MLPAAVIVILASVGVIYIFFPKLPVYSENSRDENLCRLIALHELALEYSYLNSDSNPPYNATTSSYFSQSIHKCFVYTSLTIDNTKYPYPIYDPDADAKIEEEDAIEETPLVAPNFSETLPAIASCSIDDGYTGVGACVSAASGLEDDPHAIRTSITKAAFDRIVEQMLREPQ